MEEKIKIYEMNNSFYSNSSLAIALNQKSGFGELSNGKVVYSLYEVLYLIETKKAEVISNISKSTVQDLIRKYLKKHKNLMKKYLVFRDLREKGYILKEGLKFGADFRCYEKGQKPGKEHAKYLILIPTQDKMNTKEFCSSARVANSTNKILLIALIDSEEDITYFEINWKRA